MKNSKKHIIILCVVLILIIAIGAVVLAAGDKYDFFGLGRQTQTGLQNDTSKAPGTDKESITITKQDIELLRLKKNFLGLADDEQQMIDKLVRQRVMLQEAEHLGLAVSPAEARENVAEIFAQAEKSLESDDKTEQASAQQMLDYINSYIKGLGITKEEYLDMAAEEQRIMESAQALQDHFRKAQGFDKTNESSFESEWNKYVDGLVKAAQIEITE